MRSTTRPSGLTTTRERPACRRSARPTAARAIASSASRSASVAGRKPGSAWRGGRGLARGRRARPPRPWDGRPAHAEVALDGAGDRGGGDDLAGEAALGYLGVELDDAVDVGGGAADVDDHDVAGAGCSSSRPRASSSTPVSTTSGVAPRTIAGSRRRGAEVLAADHVGEEHLADRGPGAVGGEHADPRHHVVGQHVRAPSPRIAATSSRASTLPATTTGPRQPASTSARAAREQRLGVAAVGAAGQQHDVGPGLGEDLA